MTGHYSGIIHIPNTHNTKVHIHTHMRVVFRTNFLFALVDNTNVRVLFVPWPVYYIYTYLYIGRYLYVYCIHVFMEVYLYDLMRAACASGKIPWSGKSLSRPRDVSTDYFLWFPFILPFFSANYYWYKNNRRRYTSRMTGKVNRRTTL